MGITQVDDVKFNKNYKMTRFISLLIAIEGLIMTIINYSEHEMQLFYVTSGYTVLMLIAFIHVTFSKKFYLFYIFSYFVVIYLEINFLCTGGAEGFGIIWISLIPILALYCLDFKPFLILISVTLLIFILGFFTPLYKFIYNYSLPFRIRYTVYYLVDVGFSSFLKYRIQNTEESLEQKKEILAREIKQAGVIQSTFYNINTSQIKGWKIAYRNIPMAIVTGDLYDVCSTKDTLEGFGIYDISGHGISSGLLTMLLKNIVHQEFYADDECDLWETVNRINDRFIEEKQDVTNYTTGIIARIKLNQIEFVNAAHPDPILIREKDLSISKVQKDTSSYGPIGLQGLPAIYNSQCITVNSGDKLILYTDGIFDCKNIEGNFYGEERFFDIIKQNATASADQLLNLLFDDLLAFKGNAVQSDDITIFIVQKD